MSRQDAVKSVADRLQANPPLPTRILDQTRSEWRHLALHNPRGTFGKGDNDWKRASSLLEYVAREQEGRKLSMERLAAACYMKVREFVKFHQHVGNFRQPKASPTTAPSTTGSNTHKKKQRQSSIPYLAMKLGSYVSDSHGAALRAQNLLSQLIRWSRNDAYQLQDVARHLPAYEAVCFYLTTQSGVRPDQPGDEGGGTTQQLSVATVVEVLTDVTLTEFASILEHVQSMMQTMKENEEEKEQAARQETKKKNTTNSKKRKTAPQQEDSSSRVAAKRPALSEGTERERTQHLGQTAHDLLLKEVQERVGMMEEFPSSSSLQGNAFVGDMLPSSMEPSIQDPERTFLRYSPYFLEWKECVLAQAMDSVKSRALEEDGASTIGEMESTTTTTISREEALKWAARNVLKCTGILVSTQ